MGDDATIERLLAAMETRSADPAAARSAGLALFEWIAQQQPGSSSTEATVPRAHQRALQLLDRALRAKPDDAEAAWAYAGLAASLDTSLDKALERLRHASERTPQNADLALAMAQVHEARNEPAKMLEQLENTARFSRSIEQRRWAHERIDAAKAARQKPP
jgi:tetratricopeptide (TPR) repeat protein